PLRPLDHHGGHGLSSAGLLHGQPPAGTCGRRGAARHGPRTAPAQSAGTAAAAGTAPLKLRPEFRQGVKIPRMRIGSWTLPHPVFVAPMAGVTDRPYRRLCKALGAAYAVSEMAASNPQLWNSVKTSRRLDHHGEADPIAVQIAGSDPAMMAEAARYNIEK